MDSARKVTPHETRIAELDGLRGIAILGVVMIHYFSYPETGLTGPVHVIQRMFALGWSGVDLFFVLSGFLIGGILMDHSDSPSYFKTFYLRRFFRIIPIYYLWICLFIALVGAGGPALRAHMHSGQLPPLDFDIYRHFLFLQNLWEVNYTTIAYWWFAPAWSLAVEEQFYLVAPLLVRYLPRRWLPAVLGAAILLAPVLRIIVRSHSDGGVSFMAYELTPCRADALAMGMLLAYTWRTEAIRERILRKPTRLYGALAVLFVAVVVMGRRFSDPFSAEQQSIGYSVIALFYTVLVMTAIGLRSGPVARFTRWRVFREFGRISYCLYLIHMAVQYLCFAILAHGMSHFSDWRSGLVGVVSLVAAYGICQASWRFFEHPLLLRGHRYTYSGRA
jgi:peptidoglycan/LPS O-acetylase OafA/YrhL